MSTQDQCRAARVPLGSNGEVLTANTLPSPRLKRWVAGRKAEVLAAVDCGLLSVDEACARYGISLDGRDPAFGRWMRVAFVIAIAREFAKTRFWLIAACAALMVIAFNAIR